MGFRLVLTVLFWVFQSYRENRSEDLADSDSHSDDTDVEDEAEIKIAPSKAVMSSAYNELVCS